MIQATAPGTFSVDDASFTDAERTASLWRRAVAGGAVRNCASLGFRNCLDRPGTAARRLELRAA